MLSSIGRTDPPFLISSSLYGGGGCLALRANGTGISALEATFEFGDGCTFGFGPLTGTSQIMLMRCNREFQEAATADWWFSMSEILLRSRSLRAAQNASHP